MKIKEWREVLDIMAKHSPEGEDADFIGYAGHDVVYLAITTEEIPPESEGGKRLEELRLHPDMGVWRKFV